MKISKLMWLYILSASIYACQGFEGLPGIAMLAYLKEYLQFTPEKIMYISSIISIPWLIKPIFGYFVDQYLSKKMWIILSLIGSILVSVYFGLSLILTLPMILIVGNIGNYFATTRDISNDGLACIEGKENNSCHIFQTVQWTAITISSIFVSLAGGYIADKFNYRFAYLCLIPVYLIIIGIMLCYKSNKLTKKIKVPILKTICSYKELFVNKSFLYICLFIFLYNFNPSFGTPLQFIERDSFKWSWTFMGTLGAMTSMASILGSILYFKFGRKINVKKCLFWSVFIGAFNSLCYLYFTPVSAIVYGIVFAIVGMVLFLNIMTMMAKNTIVGKEATSYALLCAIFNIAGAVSSLVGAWLLPIIGLTGLILLSSGTSFLCLPIIHKLRLEVTNEND